MDYSSTLSTELSLFSNLRQRLLDANPELDDDTLNDTLEGATNLHESISAVIRSALEDEALASGLRGRLDELETRLRRFEERASRKRELALCVMGEASIPRIVAEDFTISLRPSPPSVVISDESAVPDYFFIPQPPKLDRKKLLETLKAGECVPGSKLNAPRLHLSVRTR